MNQEPWDLEREVHHILFDVLDLTVGQEKELREKFISFGQRCQNEALERAAQEFNQGPKKYQHWIRKRIRALKARERSV